MKKYQFDQSPQLIRPPKYSGITLSLLSLFVLVCMLAVWEKMPKDDIQSPLAVRAPAKAEDVLRDAVKGFEEETGASLWLRFDSFAGENEDSPPASQPHDLLIFEDHASSALQAKQRIKENMVLLAYQKAKPDSPALVASVPETCRNSILAFQFARYLSAPTRGQFDFARAGWTGVEGDRWSIVPEIKVWISDELGQHIHPFFATFEQREGAKVISESFSIESLFKAVEIASKSEAKDFLPDIIYVQGKKQNNKLSDLSFRGIHESLSPGFTNFQIHLNLWSKIPNISERLALHCINSVKDREP